MGSMQNIWENDRNSLPWNFGINLRQFWDSYPVTSNSHDSRLRSRREVTIAQMYGCWDGMNPKWQFGDFPIFFHLPNLVHEANKTGNMVKSPLPATYLIAEA